ncbi:hypothetical protein BDV93DRAFT_521082, partial [Ceratobasidium sp. AG-I]
MAPPVPPNAPDKQRGQFLAMLSQVLAQRGVVLPPFVTGQPNPAWNPESGPLKHIQPATENRPGALRMPGAVPGRAGDLDLFKLWSAVTSGGGMQRITSGGQWENVANHIGLQLPPPLPGSTHMPAAQLAQLYFMLLSPLEEHMKRSAAQAKHMQALAAQQQHLQNQNPNANPGAQQQPLTPAQMHQQQNSGTGHQAPNLGGMPGANMGGMQAPGLGGMQAPGMGGMQPPNLGGMQAPNLGGMQNPALGGMQNPNMNSLNALQNPNVGQMQMTPAQLHQQQQAGQGGGGGGPMLTPAQMHAMQNASGGAGGMGGVGGVGGMGGVGGSIGVGGGAMPPPAPMMQVPQLDANAGVGMGLGLGGGLGIGGSKRKSEPDEDEKRAKVRVGDPIMSTPTPTSATPVTAAPATASSRRTKIEYVPLRLDVETFGGRALEGMISSGGPMERPIRDITELGTVDIPSLTLALRARTPRALSHALGTLAVLSAHAQQTFPLVRCEDLADALVEVLESAAWEGEAWAGGILSAELEEAARMDSMVEEDGVKVDDEAVKKENPEDGEEDGEGVGMWDEDAPIRTHRELVRIAAEMGLGMRVRGKAWDGSDVVGRGVKLEEEGDGLGGDVNMEEGPQARSYEDAAPPGTVRSDVVITIVRLLRNFSMGPENCAYMARDGSKIVDVLAKLVGFREGKTKPGGEDTADPLGFIGDGLWDNGVEVSITPLSSALTLPQLLRVRKDVLHTIANLAPNVRLPANSPTPRRLFSLIASFLLDPMDTRSPVQLYQHLLPHRRFSLTTDLALDALSRLAQPDVNRAILQRSAPPVLIRATFAALIKMLPTEPNDMLLLMRGEHWMAYAERVALGIYALACCTPGSVRRAIRAQKAVGASVLRMMCRLAQYDPSAVAGDAKPPGVGGWSQRNPFACLVRRVIEALRVIDEPVEGGTGEVVGWPVRGAKVEGGKGAGWLAGVGAEDAFVMMIIDGMDPVTFEDLEVLTRMGEV